MKTSKWFVLLSIILFFGFIACGGGGGKYSDAKKLIQESSDVMGKFIDNMEKAEDGKAVAAAMTTFSNAMSELQPKFEGLELKYPELKDQANPPPEIADEIKKFEELSQRMMSVMTKMMQYTDDPDVQKAQEELGKVMQ
ncbi:hypothetical protein ACFLRM_04610 [Acidobacteriota bacterium]